MASVYNLEPQPTAKAILRTTAGDLALELFAKQAPLASRNFLQHCLDGYYTGTIFHRLVPGFILQGGDPTGTGSGGESALDHGRPFDDEFHSRLKFNRRGLLGMANEGANSNGSQFFLTLGATPELQGKHTLFGRIEGETIYNLMKMAEAEMGEGEGSERPLYPTKVTGGEVLVNPFEGMAARVREAPRSKVEEAAKGKKRKKAAGKNVLSFGGDDGEEEAVAAPVVKKAKVNPKMVSTGTEDVAEKSEAKAPREKKLKRKSPSPAAEPAVVKQPAPAPAVPQTADADSEDEPAPAPAAPKQSALDRTNAEIAAIKASMRRKVDAAPVERAKPKSVLEAMIPMNSTKGRKRGKASDEKGAMDMFNAFKKRLDGMPVSSAEDRMDVAGRAQGAVNGAHDAESTAAGAGANGAEEGDEEAALCDLHFIANCQSCKSWDDPEAEAEDELDDADWMSHKLSFAKDTLGKDLEWKRKMEEIEVIDPREKARTIKAEERKGRDERKGGKGGQSHDRLQKAASSIRSC